MNKRYNAHLIALRNNLDIAYKFVLQDERVAMAAAIGFQLNEQLTDLNNNLGRIADALETIAKKEATHANA